MPMNETISRKGRGKPVFHRSPRKQRIERWAYENRDRSMHEQILQSSTASGTSVEQQRAESSFIQADRRLKVELYRLGEQREKSLEQHNFNQKLFANKQALRHKDNPDIQSTLNYVRKCCKFSSFSEGDKRISPELVRSRSVIKDTEQTQLPLPVNKRGSQSAHILSKSRSSIETISTKVLQGIRSVNSAPPRTMIGQEKKSIQIKRPSTRIFCTKSTLNEFSRHPEQFLSASNRYLPILRRQATAIESRSRRKHRQSNSRCSDHSDIGFDEAKSFLSDENDLGKPVIPSHAPSKLNLMDSSVDMSSEYTLTLSRLRDRQFTHLQELIRRNSSISEILQCLSPRKTFDKSIPPSIFTSINRENQSRKNLSKLSLLIF